MIWTFCTHLEPPAAAMLVKLESGRFGWAVLSSAHCTWVSRLMRREAGLSKSTPACNSDLSLFMISLMRPHSQMTTTGSSTGHWQAARRPNHSQSRMWRLRAGAEARNRVESRRRYWC